jgi:alkylhydroperoxidase/carboxymuconolactone decarboxylase family protein YurZ
MSEVQESENMSENTHSSSDGSSGPGLVDKNVSLLIAAGAAMAANSTSCLEKSVRELKEAGAPMELIQGAIHAGQMVKDKPSLIMKRKADALTGTHLAEGIVEGACPIEEMRQSGEDVRIPMLIGAGSAVAAGCEPCLNIVIPTLIEAGVQDSDIRMAVEIGQAVKDQASSIIQEAADVLAGTDLSSGARAIECAQCDED